MFTFATAGPNKAYRPLADGMSDVCHTSCVAHHRLPYSQPSAEGVKIVVDDVELHTPAADRIAFQERVGRIVIVTDTGTAIVDRGIIAIGISIRGS